MEQITKEDCGQKEDVMEGFRSAFPLKKLYVLMTLDVEQMQNVVKATVGVNKDTLAIPMSPVRIYAPVQHMGILITDNLIRNIIPLMDSVNIP